MTAAVMSLAELQRAMAAAVMTPLTAGDGMRAQGTDGRDLHAVAERLIAPNSRLSAFERMEIYNRQYWFRVLGSLQEDFTALRALLGGKRFDALATAYLEAHPSRSFSLRNLGAELPEWLAAHPRAAGRRHAAAVDVARLEWAFVEAFDGGEHAPLTLEQIAALDGASRLALQPHVQLVTLGCAADELVVALHEGERKQASEAGTERGNVDPAPVALPRRRRALRVAVHRADLEVYYRRLEEEEFRTLAALRDGKTLGEAVEEGFHHTRRSAQRQAQAAGEWFATWAELGWIWKPDAASADGN